METTIMILIILLTITAIFMGVVGTDTTLTARRERQKREHELSENAIYGEVETLKKQIRGWLVLLVIIPFIIGACTPMHAMKSQDLFFEEGEIRVYAPRTELQSSAYRCFEGSSSKFSQENIERLIDEEFFYGDCLILADDERIELVRKLMERGWRIDSISTPSRLRGEKIFQALDLGSKYPKKSVWMFYPGAKDGNFYDSLIEEHFGSIDPKPYGIFSMTRRVGVVEFPWLHDPSLKKIRVVQELGYRVTKITLYKDKGAQNERMAEKILWGVVWGLDGTIEIERTDAPNAELQKIIQWYHGQSMSVEFKKKLKH